MSSYFVIHNVVSPGVTIKKIRAFDLMKISASTPYRHPAKAAPQLFSGDISGALVLPARNDEGALARLIDERVVKLGLQQRSGPAHATVLMALASLPGGSADVKTLYRSLCADGGSAVLMSKLYRILKLLEQTGFVKRHLDDDRGRARSVYVAAGQFAHAAGAHA